MAQRMFHGKTNAATLADQLAARFNNRFHRSRIVQGAGTALIQVGSKHGTPVTVHIADTEVCEYCLTANPAEIDSCQACGAALPVDLPRQCPKCGRGHTSDALFCQACGTRLVSG